MKISNNMNIISKTIACAVLAVLLFSACNRSKAYFEPMQGDGNVITRSYNLGDFSTIRYEIPVEIHYVQSDTPYVHLTGDSNILAAMNPRVEGDVLILAVRWPRHSILPSCKPTMQPTGSLVAEVGSPWLKGFVTFGNPDDIWTPERSCDSSWYMSYENVFDDTLGMQLTMVNIPGTPIHADLIYALPDSLEANLEKIRALQETWSWKSEEYSRISNFNVTTHSYNGCDIVTDTVVWYDDWDEDDE